ncbi:NADP-dependent oxidoreductase [Streptomyces sp. MMBL 11-3]|uniref:NADP-dependent oxidoreductase n=1 Tax=Streptomyces sp. MMBL 11-3 TaxID=3382639 RepID=UPI0039B583DA
MSINKADGPDSITVEQRPDPSPGPGEVRIRVAAAGVNPSDPFIWRRIGSGPLQPPLTPGLDAAGTIDATGTDVDRLIVGDRVMAVVNARRPEGGAQAELVVVPAASVVPLADSVDLTAAATLPMTGLTALEGLRLLDLAPGKTLAVTGGAGQLASYLIPLAKQRGLRVIADAKPADEDFVTGLGTDHVVPRGTGFIDAVLQLVPGGVDAIFDTAALTRSVVPAIRDGGAIAVVRGWDDADAPGRDITVHAVSVGPAMQNTGWLELLAAEAARGHLPLRVAGIYPPEAAVEAYTRMEAGGLRGRLVIAF